MVELKQSLLKREQENNEMIQVLMNSEDQHKVAKKVRLAAEQDAVIMRQKVKMLQVLL